MSASVSYTHLDVYKRQIRANLPNQPGFIHGAFPVKEAVVHGADSLGDRSIKAPNPQYGGGCVHSLTIVRDSLEGNWLERRLAYRWPESGSDSFGEHWSRPINHLWNFSHDIYALIGAISATTTRLKMNCALNTGSD